MNTKTNTKSTFHGIIFALLGLGIIYFGIVYYQNEGELMFITMGIMILFAGLSKALKNISERASTFFKGSALVVFGFVFPFTLGSRKLFFLSVILGILGIMEIKSSFTAPPVISVQQTTKMTINELMELKKIEKVRDDFKKSNSENAKMRLIYGLSLILLGMFLMAILTKPVNSNIFIYGLRGFVAFIIFVGISYTLFIYKRFKDNKLNVILSLIGLIILSISFVFLTEHISFNKNCDTTVATVTHKTEGTDSSYYYKIEYDYNVNSITYHNYTTYKTSNTPNIGDKLNIYYDPTNPNKSKLNLKINTTLFMTIWVGAALYLTGPIYALKLIDELF